MTLNTPEFGLLCAMRDAEAQFFDRIVREAEDHRRAHPIEHKINVEAQKTLVPEDELTDEERRHLRLMGVEQLAEFLYCLESRKLNGDPERIRAYLGRHNAALDDRIVELKECGRDRGDDNISIARLKKGKLEAYQIDAMVDEAEDQGLRFDQSSLAALLIEAMSPESCRQLIKLMADCGFLLRKGRATVNIRSTGKLEAAFSEFLSSILTEISMAIRNEDVSEKTVPGVLENTLGSAVMSGGDADLRSGKQFGG